MGFAEIVGHQKQLATLRAALASGRLHHAYLFLGPGGRGQTHYRNRACQGDSLLKRTPTIFAAAASTARELRMAIIPMCASFEPLADKKEISIQQIREIERELNYRSFTGKRKIAIIDPATCMNVAAQNALLKTLEEPPQEFIDYFDRAQCRRTFADSALALFAAQFRAPVARQK